MNIKFLSLIIVSLIISGCNIIPIDTNTQSENTLNSSSNTKEITKPTTSPISSKDTLDISGLGLTQISQNIFKQTNLKKLDVSNNNLTGALPAEVRHLQKLEVLDASNNNMTGVPAEIGQLKNLHTLNLSNNQLTGLPYELGNLSNLQTLNLSGNNYSEQDLAIIQQTLPSNITIIK